MIKFTDSALILAAISSCLYCAYSSFFLGFSNKLGIYFDLLDKNIYQTLFLGTYVIIVPLVIMIILIIILIPLIIMVVDFIAIPVIFNKIESILKNKVKINLTEKNKEIVTKLIDISIFITIISCVILISFLFFQSHGENQAEKISRKIKLSNNNDLISVVIDNEKKNLYLITCGDSNCVGYDKESNRMYYFQRNLNFNSPVINF